ncbi:hypothetical protein [Streptomyces sp. NPDC005407]|uniref:hypothetical protein n=1 Tax=Streptomyces sp. NPDC005407 TaxID=3155340 RepID=UPI0033ABCEF2
MGDLYVVDVSLNLPTSVPDTVLSDLRWNLGHADAAGEDTCPDEFPLWAARGPAKRIYGVQIGELIQSYPGWHLTVRQEVHAESLPDVEALIERLAHHSNTEGIIGQIRFFEEDVPDLLINSSGTLVKIPLRYSESETC